MTTTRTLLLILDGWGIAPTSDGNAVSCAKTPNLDHLFATYPHTRLKCAGRAVGLPDGFMGNSEVGHMNIGAGRIVYQDMTRIDLALEQDTLKDNRVLADLMQAAKLAGGRLHFMGLLSDGGVHSHQNHLYALIELAKARGVEVLVHCFLDGRDTPPSSGADYLRQLVDFISRTGWGQ
ncbi:MAG: 2,3-bisphosphoglycerate-independent phosphoglycerate mutase, partial [Proteobacteria bacterium]|nr:2,3-bisphosphoglycerate-independent phosphoglycerate mutase [Pseudomonadota bacterium]MBU1611869.1 2,3-bisphosphoglycerate-independent phosphoglycerate mutase [Pseudomonadota bacterium]